MSDPAYRTFSYRLQSTGICARDVYDKMRPGSYQNLLNVELREENSLSSRYGLAALSTDGTINLPLAFPAQSLGRMRGLNNPYNYAAAGALFYRKATDGIGGYFQIASGLSGNRVSMYPYRPNASSAPWMFVADQARLLKDNGTGNAVNWGISPPTQPALIAPSIATLTDIELFDEADTSSFTLTNVTGAAIANRVTYSSGTPAITTPGLNFVPLENVVINTIVRSAGVSTVTTATNHGYSTGMRVLIAGSTDPSFNLTSVTITVTGANTFTYVNAGADGSATGGIDGLWANPFPSFQPGMIVTTTDGSPESVYITEVLSSSNAFAFAPHPSGFVALFANTHLANWGLTSGYLTGSIAANTVASVSKAANLSLDTSNQTVNPENDVIQIFVNISNPLAVSEIKLLFDVGDGTFTQDYYWKSVVMSAAQPNASNSIPASTVQPDAVYLRAAGAVDVRTVGGNDPSLLPVDLPLLQQLQPTQLTPGANPWTLIIVRLGDFATAGAAGNSGSNWQNIVAWKVQITTQPTLTTTFNLDDFSFTGGSDLDSFAGQAYDYRYTYYNINTGDESTPSVIMVGLDPTQFGLFTGAAVPVPLAVQRQAIAVTPLQPTDPQVTHINIYRRGGTLTQGWYYVNRIPVGTLSFTDTTADSVIVNNNLLNVDADPPVTTLLPQPLSSKLTKNAPLDAVFGPGQVSAITQPGDTYYVGQLITLDTGNFQEQVYVQQVLPGSIGFYCQYNHGSGFHTVSTAVSASTRPSTPMNLMAIAFDKAWLAGDPNNPHVLYYSVTYQPETFPVENSLEIGTPDAPIMALIELNGLLYVFTTKRVYQILGAGSAVPTVIPTGVRHGMAAQFAWCCAENAIYYLSYDGVYVFSGGASGYLSEPVEWIWTGKNLGPIPAINPAQMANTFMAYADHEVFVTYTDTNGQNVRLIYSDVYHRWRNDSMLTGSSTGVTAQYFAEDVGILFVGKSDAMVYQDRVNDFDSGGFLAGVQIVNPIPFTIQTAQMDQSEAQADYAKRYKLYNELTIDADCGGQVVTVALVFDSGNTILPMGTITGSGRQQYQLNINNGDGYESLNVGLQLSGQTTTALTFFEVHLRAAPQGEFRRSMDTWWCGFGTDEWHLYKQLFAEYRASDPNGIFVQAFVDGNMDSPVFTFTMPQTPGSHRASDKFRFPATKCRLIRFVATSNSDFIWYDNCQWEHKNLGSSKGYERGKLSP